MADKKSGVSSPAKSKNTHSKKSSGTKSKNKPKTKRKPTSSRSKSAQQAELQYYLKRNRLKKGVFLISFGLLFILLFCIPGEKLWLALHQCYWGLFGFLGCMVPVLNSYGAFQMLREKPTYRLSLKIAIYISTIILLSASVYSFSSDGMELADYGSELMNCFRQGSQYNGTGFIGGILGIPLAKLFGATGGGLVALVLFLVFLFMSLEALFINVIDKLKDPVREKLKESQELRNRVREEEKKIKKQHRKAVQEEFVQKQAEKRVESSKRKEEEHSDFRRIDKTPIYQPETSAPVRQTPSNPDAPQNNAGFTPTPKPPKKPKKKKPESPPKPVNMDYVSQDTPAFADSIDVQSLTEQPRQQEGNPEDYNDNYYDFSDETDTPVFYMPKKTKPKQSKKSYTEPDTSQPAQPKPKKEHKPKKQDEPKSDIPDFQIDNTVADGLYLKPPFTLLQPQPKAAEKNISQELNQSAAVLVDTLKSFGVQTTITHISRGPSVTRYELQPASGIKISKITNLSDDIAMNLAATGVRIEAPIPGKSAVGIEVPNKNVSTVRMRSLVESAEFQNAKSKLTVALGMDITGKITLADLSKMPHLLIAGSTGSGKSVCINSMLVSLLYKASPDEVKLMLIDPKVVELGIYNGIPHLLVPVVTDPRKAAGALNWAVNEMLKRYNIFAEHNVRDMHSYNRLVDKQNAKADEAENVIDDSERSFEEDEMLAQAQADVENAEPKQIQKLEKMPQIVIVIDELADLMMAAPSEVEESICRLAQMARAAGMHLVIATQRPSVDVITGLIKANVPSRIAFAVKSQIDSRTILDSGGAEKLLGRGDMLFSPIGINKPVRVQGCYVDDTEIERIIDFIKKNKAVEYDANVIQEIEKNAVSASSSKSADSQNSDVDPMIEQAVKCVVEAGQASTSLLQRRLRLGYARAGRLIDEMERMGIVGAHEGSKPRQVLMTYQQYLEKNMMNNDESE